MKKTWFALLLVLCMAAGLACADTISLSGRVETGETVQVYAPVGGTVENVFVREGETVTADTVIAEIRTTKVYASQDGTVTAVYGQPGDSAEGVTEKYGAVLYLEGETVYTISTSTTKGYSAIDNYLVHSGETVYLVSRNHTANRGTGVISSVAEADYTVRVTEGSFYVGDSVDVYRGETYGATTRIGRGSITRVAPEAVTGTGTILSYAVKAGDSVKRGQLLFETVDGVYEGMDPDGKGIRAGTDGTISALTVEEGAAVTAGGAVAQIYPKDSMVVVADIPEADLAEIAVGQKVKIELDWNQDRGTVYDGTVEMISAIGTETTTEETTVMNYKVYIAFNPDAETRYGMTAIITTGEDEPAAEEKEPEEAEQNAEAESAAEPAEGRQRPERGNGEHPARPERTGDETEKPET